MQVSIVLGSYNRKFFLKKTIESIRASSIGIECEIIVVDGGSSDGSVKWLTEQKDILTIVQHNRGEWLGKTIERKSWGYFMNLAFRSAKGKYLLMLSDDCLIHPDAIQKGVAFAEKQLLDGTKLGAVPFYWRNWPEMKNYWVGYVLGGHYSVNHGLYLKSALVAVDYIDEERYFFYYADGDLSLRLINSGYEVIPCRDALVEHYNYANIEVRESNNIKERTDWVNYLARWKGIYYSETDSDTGGWHYRDDVSEATLNFPLKYWRTLHLFSRIPIFAQRIRDRIARKLRTTRPNT